MFRFHDPRLQNGNDQQQSQNKLELESGEKLREVSDVDSICSVTDTDRDDDGSDSSNRKHSEVL